MAQRRPEPDRPPKHRPDGDAVWAAWLDRWTRSADDLAELDAAVSDRLAATWPPGWEDAYLARVAAFRERAAGWVERLDAIVARRRSDPPAAAAEPVVRRPVTGEDKIVWLVDPRDLPPWVREHVADDFRFRYTRPPFPFPGVFGWRMLGYATLRADAPHSFGKGFFRRRVFWTKDGDAGAERPADALDTAAVKPNE